MYYVFNSFADILTKLHVDHSHKIKTSQSGIKHHVMMSFKSGDSHEINVTVVILVIFFY